MSPLPGRPKAGSLPLGGKAPSAKGALLSKYLRTCDCLLSGWGLQAPARPARLSRN